MVSKIQSLIEQYESSEKGPAIQDWDKTFNLEES